MIGHDVLLMELGLLLLLLGVVSRLADVFRISAIPIYLLLGLSVGEGGLIPFDHASEFVGIAAQIGVIILLFSLGLEYSPSELRHSLRASAKSGVVDFVLNFTPGFLFAFLLSWGWQAGLLLGGITYVSSSGIAAKILVDLNRLGNRETPGILSLLVFEDLAMAIYLPIATGVMMGSSTGSTVKILFVAFVAVTIVLLVIFKHPGGLNKLLSSATNEVLLLVLFGLMLLIAGLSEAIHISAAVGAFIVGIAVSDRAAHGARNVFAPLRDLFATTFFVYFGMQTDPGEIPSVIGWAALLALITGLLKFIAGWYAAGKVGAKKTGRIRAGATLVARGEFSIVIAGLAVTADVPSNFAALAASYVLLMALSGPLLARVGSPKRTADKTDTLMTSSKPAMNTIGN